MSCSLCSNLAHMRRISSAYSGKSFLMTVLVNLFSTFVFLLRYNCHVFSLLRFIFSIWKAPWGQANKVCMYVLRLQRKTVKFNFGWFGKPQCSKTRLILNIWEWKGDFKRSVYTDNLKPRSPTVQRQTVSVNKDGAKVVLTYSQYSCVRQNSNTGKCNGPVSEKVWF